MVRINSRSSPPTAVQHGNEIDVTETGLRPPMKQSRTRTRKPSATNNNIITEKH